MSKKKKQSVLSKIFWRIAISAVAIALIVIVVINLLLFFFGEAAIAHVNTRRTGGSSDTRSVNQRYEWSLDYTFADGNGVIHSGHTTRRGSDISVKTDSHVYYFKVTPFINTLESEAEPNLSQPLFIAIGLYLLYVMNKKTNRRSSIKKKPSELKDYDDSVEEMFHDNDE